MAKKTRRSPSARKARPHDVGLQIAGDAIAFAARFPKRGPVISALGDLGFRLVLDVGEEDSVAVKRLWDLIQTSFETHIRPPAEDAVSFMASFPTRGGAINRHGDGGARLTLDVAEEEAVPMVRLWGFIGKDLKIRVGPRLGAMPGKDEAEKPEVKAQD